MRTIRVTGKGNIKVRPDVTRVSIELSHTDKQYSEALERSVKDTEAMKQLIVKLGFAKEDLKTVSFDIEEEYESYQDRNNNYRQRLKGYTYHHELKVEFDSDNERLGNILYTLGTSELKPEIHLSYTVKDPEAVKNKLLKKAIEDAKAKAEILSAAAGVKLIAIESIDYSWGEISFETQPMNRALKMDALCEAPVGAPLDIEPEDIESSDTVTVVWSIA